MNNFTFSKITKIKKFYKIIKKRDLMNIKVHSAGFRGEGRISRSTLMQFLSPVDLDSTNLYLVACGWKHTVFLTCDGRIFVSGSNTDGQIGISEYYQVKPVELKVNIPNFVPIWVSCGEKVSAFLTSDKKIYVCGINYGNELVELKIDDGKIESKFIYVSCGTEVICAIGEGGELYIWTRNSKEAKIISIKKIFCDVAAGKNQILAVTTDGDLYVSGKSSSCGMGPKWVSNIFERVEFGNKDIKVKKVFAHGDSSMFITYTGQVYACGYNYYSELGLPNIDKTNKFKRVITFDETPVLHIALGGSFSLFITEKYQLYSCGLGDYYCTCNYSKDLVNFPKKAECCLGKKITWCCAGLMHCFVVEGMDKFPVHPGRRFFKLEDSIARRRFEFSTSILNNELLNNDNDIIDQSDRALSRISYFKNDVLHHEGKKYNVVGVSGSSIALEHENNINLIEINDIYKFYNSYNLVSRSNSVLLTKITRSGMKITLDVSEPAVRTFGFAHGDRIKHIILGEATVIGVYGGNIWFEFDDDNGRVTTCNDNHFDYIHSQVKVIAPYKRIIKYLFVKNVEIPVEVFPCKILKEFNLKVDDLVDTGSSIARISGSFADHVIVLDANTNQCAIVSPNLLLLLRRVTDTPTYVQRKTIMDKFIEVDVSCSSQDKILPFDRVLSSKGHATLIGKKDNLWWYVPDDVYALNGNRVVSTSSTDFKLVRRIFNPKDFDCKYHGMSVDTVDFSDLPIFPDDVILLNNSKLRIIGRDGECVGVIPLDKKKSEIENRQANQFKTNISLIYRADLPAVRLYPFSSGSRLFFDVSLRNYSGVRFLPDDIVYDSANNNYGCVLGLADSEVAIKFNKANDITFFSITTLLSQKYSLLERRCCESLINKSHPNE